MKLLLLSVFTWCALSVSAQITSSQEMGKDGVIVNPDPLVMRFLGESAPLRDYAGDERDLPVTKPLKLGITTKDDWHINPSVNPNALPREIDPILQKQYNTQVNRATQIASFDGMPTNTSPGDPALDVGPNHVVQMLNGTSGATVQIWSKTAPFNSLMGPFDFSAMVGLPNAGRGDPIVLYDERADRWFLSEFCNGCNDLFIAVSTTPDPTGTYNVFTVAANAFPDYPKYSIWDNSYILCANEQANGGTASTVYALDRTSMLAGTAANAQRFTIPRFGTIGFQLGTPVSLLGTTPAGTPAMLMRMRDDAWTGAATDALEIWELDINWATPGAATLTQTSTLAISPHESEFCGYTSFSCIDEPGGAPALDPLREILMNRIMYRNFGTYESMVCAHVTDVNSSLATGLADWAGIRWYELRRTGGGGGTWSIYQEGTYAPDSDHRWMPTIGLSASGNIGLAYNVSSTTTHPDIRYTGRKECDPLGVMTEAEVVLVDGTSPNNSNRWGDYNSMGVDPVDGETFWFTAMYNVASQANTRIGAFNIAGCNPTVAFASSVYTVNEPDANVANGCLPYYVLNVPISIGVDPSQPADIIVSVTGGTATQGVDYVISNTTFTLDNPTLTGTVQIWVYNDDVVEGTETITLGYTLNANGGNATPGSLNQTVTVTINDDDLPPSLMVTTSTIFTQDFETGMNPFTTVNNAGGGGNLPWQIGNVGTTPNGAFAIPGDNTTEFAWIDDDACNCNQNDVDLLFPVLDLSTYTAATMSFDSYYENQTWAGNNEAAELRVSIAGGPFNLVTSVIASPVDVSWSSQIVDLTPYVGNASVQFSINYSDGTGWLYGCAVDNFVITAAQPISIQTVVNTGAGDQANLGPNQTIHFYDPATSDVMMTIVNTSAFDYGCVTVEVDRDGSTPTALQFASTPTPDFLHSKTYTVVPTNTNPTGTFDVTLYYKEAEVAAWESITGNLRANAEVIKVAGNNTIAGVNPGNYTTFTIDNILATVGAFNTDVTFTSSFTNGFSGFGVGIYNITTVVSHSTVNTNLTCNGDASGSIVVTASGGTAPYTYSIDGGTTFQSSNTFSGLSAGTYSVMVQDAGSTQSTASSVTLTEPVVLSHTSSFTNLTCNGNASGTITLVGSGGTGAIQYSIDGGTTYQASGSFTGLAAGTYSVIVEDANLCQSTESITITEPVVLSHTSSFTNLTCNGNASGTITLVGSGGTGTIQYSIDGGTTYQASGSFTGLAAGTYSIIVEDANLCQSTESITLTEPVVLSHTSSFTNLTCNGNASGTITLVGSGGTGAIQYSIDGGTTYQASGSFTGLAAGTYSVIVEDANLCQSTESITITEPIVLSHTSSFTNLTCNGNASGTITLVGSGGTGAIQYSIDGGTTYQASGSFTGLAAGTYSVIVEDANLCQSTESITLTEPVVLSHTSSFTNLTCNGNASGTITLVGSGGTGTIQYSIDGGTTYQASGSFTGLAAGTYSVIVEDANLCQSTESIILTEPTILAYTATLTNLSCNGSADGQIVLAGTGGTGTIQYSINGGTTFQASGTFSGLSAATYSVVVQDANSCQATGSEIITEPVVVSHTSTFTNLTCNGNASGTITLVGSGGTGAIQYSIDGGATYQASGSFTGLTIGTYSIIVQDANLCQSTESITLTEPTVLTYSSTLTNLTCNGSADGQIILVGSGGTGAIQYSIDGGTTFQASGTFTGLTAASYSVVVQDANLCQATGTETLTEPATVTYTSSASNITCNGSADGTITLTASGGSGTYQYSIDGGATFQTSGSFIGLGAATYSIVVGDASTCQATGTITITEPTAVTHTSSFTNLTCNADGSGTITLVGSGGSGSLQYSIDGGTTFQASGSFATLTAGTYSVVVEDVNACQSTEIITLTEPAAVSYTSSITNVTCNAGSDGQIILSGAGGTGSFQYSIDGGTTFQASATFSGLIAGTYNIIAEDANGCQAIGTETITEPTGVSYTTTIVDPTCNGGTDGSITFAAAGGVNPLSYSIDGGTTYQTSTSFTGLSSGTYNISVSDGNNCVSSSTVTLTDPTAISYTTSATPESCGLSDGSITFNASGGTGALQYSIDGGTTLQSSNSFTGITAGIYNTIVQDNNGCQVSGTQTVGSLGGATITNALNTEPSCNGASDASIGILASGGSNPLQYSIDGGTTFQATGAFTGLPAGVYNVVVEDATGCQTTATVTITDPLVVSYTVVISDESCGLGNGSIALTGSGGTGTLQYSIDGGTTFQTSGTYTGLAAASYSVVVQDANFCQTTGTEVVNSIAGPAINTVTATDPLCNGDSNGSIFVAASGGSGTLLYSIDGGTTFQASATFSGLTAGTYSVVVEDAGGCQATSSATLTDPVVLSSTSSVTNATCNGTSDGSVTVTPSGGTSPYQYSADGGVTFVSSSSFSGLPAGTYTYIVRDNNGCQVNGTATISEPTTLSLSFTSTAPLCNGDANGTISMTSTGGSGFNQFSIDGGATFQGSSSFTGLGAGTYNLVVEDVNGCQAVGTESLVEPVVVSYGSSTTPLSCNGANDGTITLAGSGGTGTIQYSIDGGSSYQGSGSFTGLAAGTYSIIVEDANGCKATGLITITEPAAITITTAFTDPNCSGGSDGTITLSATGGSGTLQYSTDGGTTLQASGLFSGLTATTYNVVAEDANGCQATATIILTDPAGMTYSVVAVDENCGQADGSLTFTVSGGATPYQYSGDGGTTFQTSNTLSGLAAGSYNFVIEDANGCQISGTEIVNSTSGINVASTSFTEPTCNGGNDGTASIVATGGTAPLNYSLDGGTTFQASNAFSALTAGTYNAIVEDATGCQVTTTIIVTEPIAITYTFASTPENCGLIDGSITLVGSGGIGTLQYSIDGGTNFQSSGTFTSLTANSYNIIIADANGCQTTGTETVSGSGGATITSAIGTNPLCAGNNDGDIVITATGGTAPLNYSIDGGTTFQASATFSGLVAGTYAVIVEDASGCQNSSSVTLTDPTAITYTSVIVDENCGATDGSITLTTIGGSGTLQYSIDGGTTLQASNSFTGLPAGTYSVVIIDANGCQASGSETVNGVGGATITSATATDVSCFGATDADITIVATGGTGTLQYSIDGGTTFQASGVFTGQTAGTYNVVVEDANGCQELTSVTVNSPAEIVILAIPIGATCGNNDGGATTTVTGGTGAYTYQWDDALAQTTANAINLSAGVYNVVVTDVNGCSSTQVVFVNNIGEPNLAFTGLDVSCYGASDGTAISIVTGGIAPLTYLWDDANAQATDTATNLVAGTYILQVTDAVGCIAVGSVDINEPDSLVITMTSNNTTCGFENGIAISTVLGGTPPYSYTWSDAQSQVNATAINLAAGDYTLDVIDANNCQVSDTISIVSSDSLVVTVDVIHESCLESFDGSIQTAVTGGLNPYSYLWSNGDTTEIATLLTAGNYYLTVGDANNCSVTLLVPIETLGENCISIPTAISPNGDGSNDVWSITGLQDYPEAIVEIYNRWGSLLYSATDYQNDWDGTYNGKNVPAGVYYFIVKVSDDEVYTGSLTILR